MFTSAEKTLLLASLAVAMQVKVRASRNTDMPEFKVIYDKYIDQMAALIEKVKNGKTVS